MKLMVEDSRLLVPEKCFVAIEVLRGELNPRFIGFEKDVLDHPKERINFFLEKGWEVYEFSLVGRRKE